MIAYPNVKLNLGLHVLRRREDGYQLWNKLLSLRV